VGKHPFKLVHLCRTREKISPVPIVEPGSDPDEARSQKPLPAYSTGAYTRPIHRPWRPIAIATGSNLVPCVTSPFLNCILPPLNMRLNSSLVSLMKLGRSRLNDVDITYELGRCGLKVVSRVRVTIRRFEKRL